MCTLGSPSPAAASSFRPFAARSVKFPNLSFSSKQTAARVEATIDCPIMRVERSAQASPGCTITFAEAVSTLAF